MGVSGHLVVAIRGWSSEAEPWQIHTYYTVLVLQCLRPSIPGVQTGASSMQKDDGLRVDSNPRP